MHRLGPFDIIEPIGEGGMGTVWRAVHRAQQLPAAVKFVLQKDDATDKLLARFADEVRAVAGLDHTGIVSVFDYGIVPQELEDSTGGRVQAQTPWLAMELISGGTIKSRPPKNWYELHGRLTEMLGALASAHARGILHRDLKPDNVLISGPGDLRSGLRLVDFGLAFLADSDHSDEQTAAGTPRYMAPEQLLNNWRNYGPWTDLYALGCLAWQMATGATPFQAMKQFRQLVRAHLHLAPPPFRPLFQVPDELEPWMRTLLAKRRTDRFHFAADALAALPDREPEVALDYSIEIASLPTQLSQLDATIPNIEAVATELTMKTIPLGTEPSLVGDSMSADVDSAANKRAIAERSDANITGLDETLPDMPDDWIDGDDELQRLQLLGVGLGLFGVRQTNLVGRQAERDALWDNLKIVRDSKRPRVVMLDGGPGCGKSRLANWLLHRAHELGVAVTLRCFHDPHGGVESGLPGMVQQHLRTAGLNREELEDRVAKLLDRQGVADAYEMRALCDFLETDAESSLSDFSVSMQFQTPAERLALVIRYLRRTAARRPVVLWLDDVHWGDEALALVRSLQKLAPEEHCAVLVIMTLRTDLLEDRPLERMLVRELDKNDMVHLPIGQLPSNDQVALVEDMLGLEPVLARRVVARSQGNPLFAVQLVGDWVQRNVLEVGDKGFRLRAGASADIPTSIQQLWNERIDALLSELPKGGERALEIGAVLGLEINREEWAAACKSQNIELSNDLVEGLLRRHLAVSSNDQSKFRHAHGMLRECLVSRARKSNRLETHHLSCASILEKKIGLQGVAERRARHLIGAQAHEEALDPLLRAAMERNAASDLRKAIALLDVYTKAAKRIKVAVTDAHYLRSQILRSEILYNLGEINQSVALANEVLEHARNTKSSLLIGAALRVLGVTTMRSGHAQDAWKMLEEALDHLSGAESEELRIRTRIHLANLSGRVGWLDQGLAHAHAGLSSAQNLDHTDLQGRAKFQLGSIDLRRGHLETASKSFGEAAELFEISGNRLGQANCISALGNIARLQDRFDEAERAFRQALEIHQSVGSINDLGPMMSLALAHLDSDNLGAARSLLEAGCKRCRQIEQNEMLGCALACLLPCYANSSDWQAWDEALSEARHLLEETGVVSADVARPVQKGAELALAAGSPERAKQAYEIALRQWMGLGRDEQVGEVMKAMDALH